MPDKNMQCTKGHNPVTENISVIYIEYRSEHHLCSCTNMDALNPLVIHNERRKVAWALCCMQRRGRHQTGVKISGAIVFDVLGQVRRIAL